MSALIVVTLLCSLMLLPYAAGIQCYECSGDGCGGSTNGGGSINADAADGCTMCYKHVKIHDSSNTKHVSRGCLKYVEKTGGGCSKTYPEDLKIIKCSCSEAFCNGASTPALYLYLFTVVSYIFSLFST